MVSLVNVIFAVLMVVLTVLNWKFGSKWMAIMCAIITALNIIAAVSALA